jgi:hypothetical protein
MSNVYMTMDIERVRQDAAHGVSLARTALSLRSPDLARLLGVGVLPEQERAVRAIRNFFSVKRDPGKRQVNKKHKGNGASNGQR